jgi:hypothetical protein
MACPNFKKGLKMVSGPLGVKINLSTIKNAFSCFNIHTYTFQIHYNTFQIHYNTFQKPYMFLTYITIPLLYSNILPYTSIYVESDLKPLHSTLLYFVTILFFKTVMAPHYSTKMSCTCHDMFIGIQK